MKKKFGKHGYPRRSANRFSLFVDGENYFPEILSSIRNARWYVAIELYYVEPGEVYDLFEAALLEKANQNIFVFLMFDYFGSLKLFQSDIGKLNHPFIYFKFYNRFSLRKLKNNIFRDHRKIFIVDSKIAYTGGTGITDEFYSVSGRTSPWHEVTLKVEGECVSDWVDLFFRVFPGNYKKSSIIQSIRKEPAKPAVIRNGFSQVGRLTYSKRFYFKDILRSTLRQIGEARREIYIVTAYFLPTWRFRRALKKAVKRGVSVKILLPGETTDHPSVLLMGRRYYHALLSHGVRIYEYQEGFNHSKIYICDDWVSIGSCNLDRWSLQKNLEANQEVFDPEFTAEVVSLVKGDLKKSKEIQLSSWTKRSFFNRFFERFWIGLLALAESLFSRWKRRTKGKGGR